METITTAAAHRGVMAIGRRATQLATPRRRCRARTHSSLRVQKSCSGHGRTFNKTLIDKREHGCGRGLRCVRWRGTRSRWRRAKIQALQDVETTLRHTFHIRTHLARRVQCFVPHVSEGSQCFCFLFRKEGSSSELLASLTPEVPPQTERNKSNACVFFWRVHVNGGSGRRALIEAERVLASSMQSSFFSLMSGLVFFATAGH